MCVYKVHYENVKKITRICCDRSENTVFSVSVCLTYVKKNLDSRFWSLFGGSVTLRFARFRQV